MRLVCFPHAGGNAAAYHRWGDLITREVEVWAIELPGHGSRFSEPSLLSLDSAVKAICRELKVAGLDRLPFALFGHSMGGLLAFEVAREFGNLPNLKHLFVSGTHAPHLRSDDPPIHALPAKDFLAEMVGRYDGIPEEILREKDLLELILPALRADMRMIECHKHQASLPLSCPLTIMMGNDDESVTPEEIEEWKIQTSGAFAKLVFPGRHFYLQSKGAEVLAALEARLLGRFSSQKAGGAVFDVEGVREIERTG